VHASGNPVVASGNSVVTSGNPVVTGIQCLRPVVTSINLNNLELELHWPLLVISLVTTGSEVRGSSCGNLDCQGVATM
jgi:hypothetical protein